MSVTLIALIFLTLPVYGQAPKNAELYLNSKHISKVAKDFYRGKFMPRDDDRTFSIIDSLETKNDFTRPFYLYLVSQITLSADGALSEALGTHCKAFLESKPDFLMSFLYADSERTITAFKNGWAGIIAGEFLIDCDQHAQQCIEESLRKAMKHVSSHNRSRLQAFYKMVKIKTRS